MQLPKLQLLAEGRQPNWKYTEKRVKGSLDKVILELEGADSGAMTRLAKRYERLDKSAKLLKEKRDQLNAAVKDVGDRIFDAEDALATRIIETITYTVMLTAAEKAEHKKPKVEIDFASAYAELARLVPELTEQVNAIREKYTTMIPPKDTPTALKVKPKIQEGLLDLVKAQWSKFMDQIHRWCRSYDSKLSALKAKYPVKKRSKRLAESREQEKREIDAALTKLTKLFREHGLKVRGPESDACDAYHLIVYGTQEKAINLHGLHADPDQLQAADKKKLTMVDVIKKLTGIDVGSLEGIGHASEDEAGEIATWKSVFKKLGMDPSVIDYMN